MKHKRLIDAHTRIHSQGTTIHQAPLSPVWSVSEGDTIYHAMLKEFPTFTQLHNVHSYQN